MLILIFLLDFDIKGLFFLEFVNVWYFKDEVGLSFVVLVNGYIFIVRRIIYL